MVSKNLFLGKMVSKGYTQKSLAKELKMSPNTLGSKINGCSDFDTSQILEICKILGISSDKEKCEIFLNESSQKRDDKLLLNEEVV